MARTKAAENVVVEVKAEPQSPPPEIPTEGAPPIIPPDRKFIALIWDESGQKVSIRLHPSFTAEQAQLVLARAGLMILDAAVAKAAETAEPTIPEETAPSPI